MDRIANIIGSIIVVALVTTVVAHPTTATVIRATGFALSDSLRAAMGQ